MNEKDLVIGAYYEMRHGAVAKLSEIDKRDVVWSYRLANGTWCKPSDFKRRVYLHDKPPEIELKEGAFVELNDGSIVGPVKPCDSKAYPWIILGCFMYTSDGRIVKIGDDSSPRDIKRIVKVTVHD
jgi:hypothetical protein